MKINLSGWCLLAFFFFLAACKTDPSTPPAPKPDPVAPATMKVPRFEQDSAFTFVEKQLAFGPRVTNTPEHEACKQWLVEQFKNFGAEVIEQNFTAKAYTGINLKATNIIAQYNPKAAKRVVLAAHWDSRHISDQDKNEANKNKPVMGADDGGSAVAILLEVARQLGQNPINMGVDIVLFDAEDYGESQSEDYETWCLGSQYWSKNLHVSGYKAKFGILVDMAGAKNARFTTEAISRTAAPQILDKVWQLAINMGYGNYFVNVDTRVLIDDHLFVNRNAKIPMIDIINRPADTESGFGHYWHTQEDNINVIDRRTLRAVGQTLLAVVYNESIGKF